jgi:glycosyltransferase involved in cell wall biosynthesis
MIRITHVLPFKGVGGTEQMVLNLCKFRNRTGFDCAVAMPGEGLMADEIRKTGVRVYTGWPSYHAAMNWADIVNLHWLDHRSDLHSLVESSRKPYVTTLHWASEMPDLPALTICTARYTYQIQRSKHRFVVIPNGVDLSQFYPRPRQHRKEVIITRVCRPVKCALYFWTAMREVLDRYSQARLWIVGNEDGFVGTTDIARFFGIRRDIPEILAETDIFAYTPYPDTGSNDLVVMEASAMGVPCVVSDVNAVRESVENGKNGFLTPYGDKDAFAHKVEMLVENASLRKQMGQIAIRIAQERFDMHRVARCYEDIYRSVLNFSQNRSAATRYGVKPVFFAEFLHPWRGGGNGNRRNRSA